MHANKELFCEMLMLLIVITMGDISISVIFACYLDI